MAASIFAPMAVSGVITRFIGRRESDPSPTNSLSNPCPARMPLSIRMVEPEFPQSNGASETSSTGPSP